MIDPEIQKELRQKYNPDGSMLRSLQTSLMETLIEFDKVCREEGVVYWLDAGTLLGAVRHGGFIPWDDDLDVCVLKKDRKKLKEAMQKGLKLPFRFIDANTQEYTAKRWARVVNDDVLVSHISADPLKPKEKTVKKDNAWIDIMYLVNGRPFMNRNIDRLFGPCFRRKYKLLQDGRIRHLVAVCLYPFTWLLVQLATLVGKLFMRKQWIFDYGLGYYSLRVTDETFPLGEIEFEGHMFPAPCRCDEYLTRLYGDWCKIPNVTITHNVVNVEHKDSK